MAGAKVPITRENEEVRPMPTKCFYAHEIQSMI
jgi:hypothetical protein